jgi:hypothetical protein
VVDADQRLDDGLPGLLQLAEGEVRLLELPVVDALGQQPLDRLLDLLARQGAPVIAIARVAASQQSASSRTAASLLRGLEPL